MTAGKRIRATCHCGAVVISARLRAPIASARRCNCSFCRRRQAANVSADWDSLRIEAGADALQMYQFGTHRAEHYFCKSCGIYTHHRRFSDQTEVGINIGCIDGIDPSTLEPLGWVDGTAD